MQSAVSNRFQANVKKKLFKVSEFEIEYRSQGHVAILVRVSEHEGMPEIVEDLVDSVTKLPGGVQMSAKAAEKVIANLAAESSFSIGQIVGKLVTRFPRLVLDLLTDGAILQGSETPEDYQEFLCSLTVGEVTDLVLQWYDFNFESGIAPLFEEAKAKVQARRLAKKAGTPAPKPIVPRPGLRR